MSTRTNRQVLLNAHPVGFPVDTDFKMVESPMPEPGDSELLIRTIYQSLDPYMRGRMNPGLSYTAGVSLGEVMGAGTVGQGGGVETRPVRRGGIRPLHQRMAGVRRV